MHKTASICNKCLERVPAEVYEKKGIMYIRKKCKKHGTFTSPHVYDDPEMYRFMHSFHKFKFPSRKVLLNITNKCNMNCRFCYAKANEVDLKELSFEDIKKLDLKCFEYIFLSGGEPTIKKDLFKIIRYFKDNKKKVFLLTNGLKLQDEDYALKLKKSGVDLVVLQFDSLCEEDVKYLRKKNLVKNKLKIIDNLSKFNIPVYFFSIQLKKNNLKNMKDLVKLFKKYSNVLKGINFNTIWRIGRYDDKNWMSTGEITKNSCKVLNVSKYDYLESTEFMYYLFILASKLKNKRRYFSKCLTFMLVIFDKDKIIPITKIFNLSKMTKYLKKITIQNKYHYFIPFMFHLIFVETIFNIFNRNYRLLLGEVFKRIKYLFHKNIFLLNPFTTFNVGEFPTAEDFDWDFVDTCNLFYYDPKGNVLPVCLNQIKFARGKSPIMSRK